MYDEDLIKRYCSLMYHIEEYRENYATWGGTDEEFALIAVRDAVFKSGKSKIDKTRRISLINEIAEILDAKSGDEIEYIVTFDGIKIRKVTSLYKGYDIEQDLIDEKRVNYILERLVNQLESEINNSEMKGVDYEAVRKEYLEWKKNQEGVE